MTGTVRRARGTLTILRSLPGQRSAHYRPPEWMRAERDRRVRRLVLHAADHVPYYRELFAREAIDPRELGTAGDLARLPIIDKHTLRERRDDFLSTGLAPGNILRLRTNGSTGPPAEVCHDREALLATVAHSERDRAVEAALCGRRYRYRVVEIRNLLESAVGTVQEFYGRSSFRPLRPRVYPLSLQTPVEEVVRRLDEVRPEVLRGFGSYLEAFFRAVSAQELSLRAPKVVVYYGDLMSPDGRRLVEERFGVPVLSRYGAVEAFRIGFTCEERAGFHVHEDLCHVRLVDGAGNDVAEGEPGEVVISNLVNRGSLLLNYRLGDVARLSRAPCACGRTTVRLAEIQGRVADVLAVDGKLVHQYTIGDTLAEFDEVVAYQLAQLGPRRFELRLATAPEGAYLRVAPAAVARLQHVLAGCDISAAARPNLVVEEDGKVRRLVPLAW
jgi:phenylacetate-CoA ligase